MQSQRRPDHAPPFRGKDSILSGPAGGIVGMARTAEAAGFGKVIGFDMGGTSTDVSHFAGEFERQYETAGRRGPDARAHAGHPHGRRRRRVDPGTSTAAGTGSAPDSAGAVPGPAAYRRGGPLTVTDANIMLGRIQAAALPARVRPAR